MIGYVHEHSKYQPFSFQVHSFSADPLIYIDFEWSGMV